MLAIDSFPASVLIKDLVESASDRVAVSFSRRLGYLHDSKGARKIVQGWLEPGGRYGNVASLTDTGRQIFSNIAPVHQESALNALDRASQDPDFVSTNNRNRSYYTKIARSLAYEPALFGQAVEVLQRFALAEPERYRDNSSRDMLRSLFFCHLSGTEARADHRSEFVQSLLRSENDGRLKLGLLLLDAALEGTHFLSSYGFYFGARKRGYGWSPRGIDDLLTWYHPFLEIAVEAGSDNSVRGREARVVLAKSVRGLWNVGLQDEIATVVYALSTGDGWPEGWHAIRSILQWDKDNITEETCNHLRDLEKTLAPVALKATICAKVLSENIYLDDLDDEHDAAEAIVSRYSKSERESTELGKMVTCDDGLLAELLPEVMQRHDAGTKVWHFGFGVGLEILSADDLVVQIRNLVVDAAPGNVDLLFFRGFISGRHSVNPIEVNAFLDAALTDDVWGKRLPELQLQTKLDTAGYDRILRSLELGDTPIWQYRYLGFGRATDPLTVDQALALVYAIAAKENDGLSIAIDLLRMVIHCAREKEDDYRRDLATATIRFVCKLDWPNAQSDIDQVGHNVAEIIKYSLTAADAAHHVPEMLCPLLAFKRSEVRAYSQNDGELLVPFLKSFPKQTLDAIYLPDEDGQYRTACKLVALLGRSENDTAIVHVPDDGLIEWCDISPDDRYLFAARTCRLFVNPPADLNTAVVGLALSDVAVRILASAGDKQAILRVLVNRFRPRSWSGSRSTILKQRLPLLAQMNPNDDPVLQSAIAGEEEKLRTEITTEETQEEAEERLHTGSFE